MEYFSLTEARELLPKVQQTTKKYYDLVEKLYQNLNTKTSHLEKEEIQDKIENYIQIWASEMIKLGLEVKGPWLVDFDSGDGYFFCWKYDEEDIKFFHLYETGFSGRRPIELLE